MCCRTASEIHVTKRDVNPRIATGGVMPEVIKLTKRAILSAVGALDEYAQHATDVKCKHVRGGARLG